MADYTLLHLLPLICLLTSSTVAQNNGNISIGSSLTATDRTTPWLSPSGDFAFGFQQLQNNKDLFVLSIWFHKLPDQTIVWYPWNVDPLPRGTKLELTSDRGLVLSNSENSSIWSTNSIADEVSYGFFNDTGNFVLARSDSVNIWQSFDNPTDTLLPTQIM
ncbi:unnamed protein product [Ilex paraguariensis]|uniref:Bulb-type lectin domain-containing protein n=1 Tax=Ilex paraguariensis TaxID=185542 RepID=A0ABC8TTU2_9AQUA